jgi:long-subunit acyl-CoA synthetase (AMP-forming)
MTSIVTPDVFKLGSVGLPMACVEVKLVDVPDAGYLSSNKPLPQGEVWLRGPSVSKGYFKNEAATTEAYTSDGWFQTGDIGKGQHALD